jgi:Family of unknown function (DUF6326)
MMDGRNTLSFEDIRVHVRFKLFALWSSVMFFYIYGDYFELYQPGKLQESIAGRMPFGAISQGALLGMAAVMIIPSLMPFLSLVLPAGANRRMNIVFGAVYSVIMMVVIRWLALLCPFRFDRNHPDSTDHLVRVDLAEAANPLIASTAHRGSGQFRMPRYQDVDGVLASVIVAVQVTFHEVLSIWIQRHSNEMTAVA